jgi:integrase
MKKRYRVIQRNDRGGMCYCVDTVTGARPSLQTRSRPDAERIVLHKNEAADQPHINRKIGMAYLAAADPKLVTRIWQEVMEDIIKDKQGPTLKRWKTAIKDPALNLLRKQVVVATMADDFMAVLRAGTVSTNVHLRRLQNHALDMGWLPMPVLPKRKFPKIVHQEKRAVTWEEHCRIIERERNPERRDFYDLCWYFGGSQSDVASLRAEDIDYQHRGFAYDRLKTGNMGGMRIGDKAWEILLRRPRTGPLFPHLMNGVQGWALKGLRSTPIGTPGPSARPTTVIRNATPSGCSGRTRRWCIAPTQKRRKANSPRSKTTRRPTPRRRKAGKSSC